STKHACRVLESDGRECRRGETTKRRHRFYISNDARASRRIESRDTEHNWSGHLEKSCNPVRNLARIARTIDDMFAASFNMLIAATPLARASKHSATCSTVTPPIASTGHSPSSRVT